MQDVVFVVALTALVGVTVGVRPRVLRGRRGRHRRAPLARQFGCCPDSDKELLCAVSSGH